jgi:glycopeptide antibiotics resistance protein
MWKRSLATVVLAAYCALLIQVMVFKDIPTIRIGGTTLRMGGTESGGAANLVPFSTILPYLTGERGWFFAVINLVGNVALLVPVGLLLPFVVRRCTWAMSLIVGIACGLAVEVSQAVLDVGHFDVDDVILNALGVVVGYAAIEVLTRARRRARRPSRRATRLRAG